LLDIEPGVLREPGCLRRLDLGQIATGILVAFSDMRASGHYRTAMPVV
jgi:hypothetical protein